MLRLLHLLFYFFVMDNPNLIDLNSNRTDRPERSFKLGTTSFIFPDHIIPNVKKLGRHFDEIELLVFESQPEEVLPSRSDVKELSNLSDQLDLNYNIHLPIDVTLCSESEQKRVKASETILKVIELFAPLNPTTHTLHIDMLPGIKIKKNTVDHAGIKKWQESVKKSLKTILSHVSSPDIISIETLDYPFGLVEPFIEEFRLSVCIDVGHQIKYGDNLLETFDKHRSRTPVIHLHGVDFSGAYIKDHTSLDKLPKQYVSQIQTILNDYTGVVSLEVFSLEKLCRSLRFLSKIFS